MTAVSAAEVTAALDRLGDTPDRVAATLAAKGHVGCAAGIGGYCPIHDYLQEQFPEVDIVGVGSRYVFMPGLQVRVPDAVYGFIRRFDGGAYPELVS